MISYYCIVGEKMKKNHDKFIYSASMIIIVIVFLVIFLLGDYVKVYSNNIDNIGKSPVNNIFATNKDDTVVFDYTIDKSKGNVIKLYNQFPTSDEVGKNLSGEYREHNFELTLNEKAVGVKYYITVEKLVNSDFNQDYVKIYLDNEGRILKNCYRDNGRIKTFNEYAKYKNKNDERILYSGTITEAEAKRGSKRFTFKMWVSEDLELFNENYYSQSFLARINVYATGDL